MSYILDALKKSDQQRQRGATPTLRSSPVAESLPEKKPGLPYVLLAVLLLVAGVVIGWLRPWHTAIQEAPAAGPGGAARSAPPLPSAAPQAAPVPPAASTPPAAAAPPALPSAPAVPDIAPRLSLPAAVRSQKTSPEAPPRASPAWPATSAADPASAAPNRVLALEELPLPVRQGIPPLTISLHAYSPAPRKRLVSINNQLLHEGDSVAPGVTLEEITPNGMILSYRGYRFQRGVQ